MRIEENIVRKNVKLSEGKVGSTVKNKKTVPLQQNFQDLLQEQNLAQRQEQLALLLESLDEIGKRLVKSFSIHDLLAYKERLRGFLDEISQQIYELRKEFGWTGTGRSKLYQRIELLDQELEDLTRIILEKQKDPVRLLKKLDNIRGLLVDLYS